MKTLIRNANVWQKGKFLTKDVLVDGERIAVVGKLPEETQCDHEVDGTGKFLLPGVIDCHAHSTMVCGTRHMPDFFASSDAELTLDGAINAEKMVRCGITTIRDCGGRRFETLAVRDYINKGKLIGPRMLCSGTPLKVVGGHEPGADYTGPWEARARVREFLMHGVDFLKVMVTGGLGKAGEDPGLRGADAGGTGRDCFRSEKAWQKGGVPLPQPPGHGNAGEGGRGFRGAQHVSGCRCG